jgi:DNA primase
VKPSSFIKQDTVNQIFDTLQIEEVVGDFVSLKKRGNSLLGLCPFHNEKTPSFNVSVSKGIYKCFGCGEGGNAVDFVMKHEKYSYPEALRYLAKKYAIEIEVEEQSEEQQIVNDQRESLFIVTNWASDFFHKQLWESDEGKAIGLSYFKERGYKEETIKKFELGYSAESWDLLTLQAKREGYNDSFLADTGLIVKRDDGKIYDRFRGRVMFPIHNLTGRVLGFGARTLKSDKKVPKYVNSPESTIYHKSDVLYGLYLAKKSIVDQDNCFLVEGYADVIAMHQAGVENVVSSSGTSLTSGQIRLISRFSKNVTLLFDGDVAGVKASLRGADMLLQEGLNVKVLLFQDGRDPDSYIKEYGASKFKKYVEEYKQDFISFKTHVLLKDAGADPIKRAGVIREVVESIALIPDQIKAAVFIRECSQLLEIEERVLIAELNSMKIGQSRKTSQQQQQTLRQQQSSETDGPPADLFDDQVEDTPLKSNARYGSELKEQEIIRLLLNYGHMPATWEQEGNLPIALVLLVGLEDVTFHHPACKKVIDIYLEKIEQQELPEEKFFIQHQDKEVSGLAVSLLTSRHALSPNWADDKRQIFVSGEVDNLKETIIKALHRMKKRANEIRLEEVREKLKIERDPDNILILMSEYQKYKQYEQDVLAYLGTVIVK